MSFKPTPEQQAIDDAFRQGKSIAVEALAGSGKTSTLKLLARSARPGARILYTSFGKKNIEDAKASFTRNVKASSNHALAFAAFGAAYANAGRLTKLTARGLAEQMRWGLTSFPGEMDAATGAHFALQTLANWFQSADSELGPEHVCVHDHEDLEASYAIQRAAARVWAQMADPKSSLPVTHDAYLKLWALSNPVLRYDAIFLDEAQDSTPLIVDVLRRQSAQLVVVGDSHQQIYSFRGAINAMTAFDVHAICRLTQSFRFGPAVADAANIVLQSALDSTITLRGADHLDSRLGAGGENCVVARSNMALFGAMADVFGENRSALVVGGTRELEQLIASVDDLLAGKPPLAPELQGFKNWDEVVAYAKTPPGRDVKVLCQLVDSYGVPTLKELLSKVPSNPSVEDEKNVDVVLTTAHKSKGREWDNVRLTDDFAEITADDLAGKSPKGSKWTPEQSRLLYVAVTRAQKQLDLAGCSAWNSHRALLAEQSPKSRLIVGPSATAIPGTADSRSEAPPETSRITAVPNADPLAALRARAVALVDSLSVLRSEIAALPPTTAADGLRAGDGDFIALYREARAAVTEWRDRVNAATPAESAIPPRRAAAPRT